MRALIAKEFGSPDNLSLGEMPEPSPGPDEVLVKVHATAVNYVDLLVISGEYQFLPALPFIPGKGPAGKVISVGAKVDNVTAGQRVLAMAELGGFGQLVTVSKHQCFPIPDAMSFTDAAAIALVYDTAWFALRDRARCQKGDVVLVLGASGGVGYAAVQLAKAMGTQLILAGVSSSKKAQSYWNNPPSLRRSWPSGVS